MEVASAQAASQTLEDAVLPTLGPADRVLVVGTGGSLDCLAAYGVAELLRERGAPGAVVLYANADLIMEMRGWTRTGHGCLYRHPGAAVLAKGAIDARRAEAQLPLGAEGSPLVFRLPFVDLGGASKEELLTAVTHANLRAIGAAVEALQPTLVVGVDVGGDALTGGERRDPRLGQDWQVLNALRCALSKTNVPLLLAVVGLGADGESTRKQLEDTLEAAAQAEALRGRLQVEGRLLDALSMARTFGVQSSSACPNIVLAALDGELEASRWSGHSGKRSREDAKDEMIVPRNSCPCVPKDWLTGCFVFNACWVVEQFSGGRSQDAGA